MVKKEGQQSGRYRPKVGDKIICTHGEKLYEAKVLTVRGDEKNPSEQNFFVHYQGWSKSWDEWVHETRVVKWTEAGETAVKEQKSTQTKGKGSARKNKLNSSSNSLNASALSVSSLGSGPTEEKGKEKVEKEPKEKKTTVSATKTTSSIVAPKDNQNESLFEDLEVKKIQPEVKIKIPEELINWLVDDDNNVKNKKLSIIPAKVPISTIFKDYVNFKKTSTKLSTDKELVLNEFILGLKYYFNIMIGAHLLYKFERTQYQSLIEEQGNNADFTAFYGTVHLIRLFTKMGVMLAFTTFEGKEMQVIVGHIQDMLKFIKKQANLFDVDKSYQIAPPEYIRQCQRAVD